MFQAGIVNGRGIQPQFFERRKFRELTQVIIRDSRPGEPQFLERWPDRLRQLRQVNSISDHFPFLNLSAKAHSQRVPVEFIRQHRIQHLRQHKLQRAMHVTIQLDQHLRESKRGSVYIVGCVELQFEFSLLTQFRKSLGHFLRFLLSHMNRNHPR